MAEILQRCRVWRGSSVTERTERTTTDLVAEIHKGVDLCLAAMTMFETFEHASYPVRTFAAWSAFATGLVLVKLQPTGHCTHNAHGVIEQHWSAGAKHGPRSSHVFVGERKIEVLCGEHGHRRAARQPELHRTTVTHATCIVKKFAHGDTERCFIDARTIDMTGDCKDLEPRGLLGTKLAEPLNATINDEWHIANGLDVIDYGRCCVQARYRREWWLKSWLTATTLERIQKSSLFTTNICTCTGVHRDAQVESATQNIVAQETSLLRFADRSRYATNRMRHFAPDIDKGVVRPNRIGRDDYALDKRVWSRHHDRDVFAGAWLGLICIYDEVMRLAVVLRNKAPLESGGEPCATSATQPRVLNCGDDRVGLLLKRLSKLGVPTDRAVASKCVEIRSVPVSCDNRGKSHISFPALPRERTSRAPARHASQRA